MKKINFYNIAEEEKKTIFQEISNQIGIPAYAVEKDWWVVQTLSAIFGMEVGKYLIFKGGTSLSKAWGLIERFSEDVDLAFDRTYLGFDGELTRSGIKTLRKKTGKYISEAFSPELETRLKEKGLTDIKLHST